jgi:hypothetical protein
MNLKSFVGWNVAGSTTARKRANLFASWSLSESLPTPTAFTTTMKICIGGAWKAISNIQLLISNTWKNLTSLKLLKSNLWKTVN